MNSFCYFEKKMSSETVLGKDREREAVDDKQHGIENVADREIRIVLNLLYENNQFFSKIRKWISTYISLIQLIKVEILRSLHDRFVTAQEVETVALE